MKSISNLKLDLHLILSTKLGAQFGAQLGAQLGAISLLLTAASIFIVDTKSAAIASENRSSTDLVESPVTNSLNSVQQLEKQLEQIAQVTNPAENSGSSGSSDQGNNPANAQANPIANSTDNNNPNPQSQNINQENPENNLDNSSNNKAPQISILSPSMDTLSDVPAVTVILRSPIGSELELSVNGRIINSNAIGRTDVDASTNTVTQTWYGVVLDEGDNVITAKIVGSQAIATTRVKLRGAATQLQVNTLESRIAADGRSTATVQGLLLDEKGDRSNRGGMVTLTAGDGEFIGTDAQPDQPGFQVEAREGQFSALLKSSLNSGAVRIRANARLNNSEAEAFTQLQFETNLRPSIVTGVVDLRIGAR